jgi:hypothetical protein
MDRSEESANNEPDPRVSVYKLAPGTRNEGIVAGLIIDPSWTEIGFSYRSHVALAYQLASPE